MKQKEISQQLGSLISQTQGMYNTNINDDAIPSELQDPEPIFEVDYDDEQTKAVKKARETVSKIIGSVMPSEYQSDPMIADKKELDATQLGMLYYQQHMNDVMMRTAIDAVAKGDLSPRMFEVYEKLAKRGSELSKQITETQNQFRKYYIDTYQDIEVKTEKDAMIGLEQKQEAKQIENKEEPQSLEDTGNRASAKDMIKMTNKAKTDYYKNKLKKAQEAEYTEVK